MVFFVFEASIAFTRGEREGVGAVYVSCPAEDRRHIAGALRVRHAVLARPARQRRRRRRRSIRDC